MDPGTSCTQLTVIARWTDASVYDALGTAGPAFEGAVYEDADRASGLPAINAMSLGLPAGSVLRSVRVSWVLDGSVTFSGAGITVMAHDADEAETLLDKAIGELPGFAPAPAADERAAMMASETRGNGGSVKPGGPFREFYLYTISRDDLAWDLDSWLDDFPFPAAFEESTLGEREVEWLYREENVTKGWTFTFEIPLRELDSGNWLLAAEVTGDVQLAGQYPGFDAHSVGADLSAAGIRIPGDADTQDGACLPAHELDRASA